MSRQRRSHVRARFCYRQGLHADYMSTLAEPLPRELKDLIARLVALEESPAGTGPLQEGETTSSVLPRFERSCGRPTNRVLVGLPQLPVLPFKRLQLGGEIRRHARTPAIVDLGLLYPFVGRLCRTADLGRPIAMSARPGGPQPSGRRAPGPREKTCGSFASSWLPLSQKLEPPKIPVRFRALFAAWKNQWEAGPARQPTRRGSLSVFRCPPSPSSLPSASTS